MYKITITRVGSRESEARPSYQVIDKRPFTDKELAEANSGFRSSPTASTAMKEVYGYPPPRKIIEEVEVEVLKQTVDDLDLTKVIKAINNL